MISDPVLLNPELPGLKLFKRGKVREVYDLGSQLLIVATDRISAFDYILPNGIPCKGKVLTGLSVFWFNYTRNIIKNHFISADTRQFGNELDGRAILVYKTEAFPVECVVRGYLAGSGWKEYKEKQSVCGISLAEGYKEADQLEEPIFTPATKAVTGHDENIGEQRFAEIVGDKWADKIKEASLQIYKKAHQYALEKGIIIADTKFEFGLLNNELILIDEILTPDSSRFWPKALYSRGENQFSFDKQFVRNYLESINWDKQPPVPKLPPDIVHKTREKYLEAYRHLTGRDICL